MIDSLNFRRPLNISFSVIAVTLLFIGIVESLSQWSATQEAKKTQNRIYLDNVAAFMDKYLDGYENIMREMTRIAAERHTFDKQNENDLALRNWMIERLRIMPDALSIIHVSNNGHYIRLPYIPLNGGEKNAWDPRKEPWFTLSVEDSDEAHYSISRDPFANRERVITISLPIIDGTDGTNTGVLALNLDLEKSTEILNTALPPVKSRTFVMNRQGEPIINPGYEFAPGVLKAIALNAREYRGDFVMNNRYYTYRTIGSQSWLVVHEVDESVLGDIAFRQCMSIVLCTLAALIVVLFCWWSTRAALNAIFMRIAASIRSGDITPASVEEIIYEEIHSSQQRQTLIAHEALTDGLTGLKNRRAFDADAARLSADPHAWIAMIDIDNFKNINDTWGHTVGDMVLKTVADLGSRLRGLENIFLYRYGGEEIAVLFQGISAEKAQSFLEKWRITVNTRSFREKDLKVSFSAGLCRMGGAPLSETLACADRRLYQAKKNGKNRIVAE